MAIWKKRGEYQDVLSLITGITGSTAEELTNPVKVAASSIVNISEAASLLMSCLQQGTPIVIVGDYDVDGITATAILVKLLSWYGITPRTIIPRRFTDGYGISDTLLDGIENSLIITVDNGIAAGKQLIKAKERGNRVIILDHHLSSEVPDIDVVVDPHVTEGESAFSDYCGAGLALKLCEQLLPFPGEYPELFYNLTVLACLGTIADVMPLIGDNRRIVKEGLQILRSKKGRSLLTPGLREIIKLGGDLPDEETIKFTLAPIINAVGRMYDAGSTSALKAVLCNDEKQAISYASKMRSINDERKNAVAHWLRQYRGQVDDAADAQVLYVSGVPEGIIGIIAGNLAESCRMPVFVFTDAKEDGMLKGSARSYGDFDLFELIQFIRDDTVAAGGHAGAAGLTITSDNLQIISDKIHEYAGEHITEKSEDVLFYDLVLRPDEVVKAYEAQKRLAPFGEGCPQPVFVLRDFRPVARYGDVYKFMGSNGQHVKANGPDFEVVMFNEGEKIKLLGLPESLDIICTLGVNVFNGKTNVQVKPIEFIPSGI